MYWRIIMEGKNRNILISKEEIAGKVAEVGEKISKDYKNKDLYILSLLRGS